MRLRAADGLLNLALAAATLGLIVLGYGLATRTLTPRTSAVVVQPAAAGADSLVVAVTSVEILNGSGVDGLGRRTMVYLRARGFDVREVRTARPTDSTLVQTAAGTRVQAERTAAALGLDPARRVVRGDSTDVSLDVTVLLGPDAPGRIPFDAP